MGLVLPHACPLARVRPSTAAAIWLLSLVLRAMVVVGAAFALLIYVPQTPVYGAASQFCPQILGLHVHGYLIAGTAVHLPLFALAISLALTGVRLVRAAMAVNRAVASRLMGAGPRGSTLVAADEIVVAVPGLGPSTILVSEAAVRMLDRSELDASIAHECGHLRRRHRPVLIAALMLRAIAFALPGTSAAHHHLRFQLERDADEYAVRQTGDPLALASAICKVAQGAAMSPMIALGGAGSAGARLELLLDSTDHLGLGNEHRARALAAGLLVVAAATLVVFLAAAPSAAHALGWACLQCSP